MARWTLTPEQRFAQYVSPEPNTGCWIWIGSMRKNGYGAFYIDRLNKLAHRVAWELFSGPIPDGMFILHRCDNRPCVNPDHLFVGTHQDNCSDMASKGRGSISKHGLPFGVAFRRDRVPQYKAFVKYQTKQHWLGSYTTAEEAHAVAVAFKNKLYSEEPRP